MKFLLHIRFTLLLSVSFLLSGCGGSMGSSTTGWGLASVVAYGSPDMEIVRENGAPNRGHFNIKTSTPTFRVGDTVFVEASYSAEVPNVNSKYFTTDETAPVGTFHVVWSEVAPADTASRVTFTSGNGVTFTEYEPSPNPNVRVAGLSGVFIKVSTPGPVKLKFRATLQLADGSSRSKDYETTLFAESADGT